MRPSQIRNLLIGAVLLVIFLWGCSAGSDFVIDYNWWKEIGQVSTWISMLWYSVAPFVVAAVVAFIALYVAHARGLHFAGIRQRDFRLYSRLSVAALAVLTLMLTSASVDYWTVMRFFGSLGVKAPADAWKDQVFSRPLPFYLFDLPFYSQLLGFIFCPGHSLRAGVLDHGPRVATVDAWRLAANV